MLIASESSSHARNSIDAIGMVGFSHDFGMLDGKRSVMSELFDTLGSIQNDPLSLIFSQLGYFLPFLWKFSVIGQLQLKLGRSLESIANNLLENADKQAGKEDKSIIGILGAYHVRMIQFPISCWHAVCTVQAEEVKGLPKSAIVDHVCTPYVVLKSSDAIVRPRNFFWPASRRLRVSKSLTAAVEPY